MSKVFLGILSVFCALSLVSVSYSSDEYKKGENSAAEEKTAEEGTVVPTAEVDPEAPTDASSEILDSSESTEMNDAELED